MQLLCKLEYKRRLGQENRWHLRQSILLIPPRNANLFSTF